MKLRTRCFPSLAMHHRRSAARPLSRLLATGVMYVISVLLGIAATPYSGRAIPSDLQSWTSVSATINLDPDHRWFFYLEAQPRVGDSISRLERLILREAVGYNITNQLSVAVGYGWIPSFYNASYRSDFRNENRLWQQLLFKEERWGLQWQHRLRLEQRLIQDVAEASHRGRYFIKTSVPLGTNDSLGMTDFGLTGFNELFFNFNGATRGPKGGFDRNRTFIGPYGVVGPARYEFGYLAEYAPHFGSQSRLINAIMLNAMFSF